MMGGARVAGIAPRALRALGLDAQVAERAFESRRRPRTDWVRAQTHRRDRTRRLPRAARDVVLRTIGPRIFRANYAQLLAEV
jgi:hypothetical protein